MDPMRSALRKKGGKMLRTAQSDPVDQVKAGSRFFPYQRLRPFKFKNDTRIEGIEVQHAEYAFREFCARKP